MDNNSVGSNNLDGITWDSQPVPSQAPQQSAASAPPAAPASPTSPDLNGITWDSQPTQGGSPATPQSDEIQINSTDDPGTKLVKGAGQVLEGAGEGVFSTLAGASDIVDRFAGKGPVNSYLHMLAGDNNTTHSTLNRIGYGGETLEEFLLGDEALKALPLSKKLETAAKIARTVEGSPRTMRAMQIGSALLKKGAIAGAENAILQGGQTFVRSGGDVGQAVKEGAEGGLVGGAVGGAAGVAGDFLGEAGNAAKTVQGMSTAAENAIPQQTLFENLGDHITQEKNRIDQIFNDSINQAQNAKDSTLSQAEADQQAAEEGAQRTKEDETRDADNTLRSRQNTGARVLETQNAQNERTLNSRLQQAETGLQAAKQHIQATLVAGLDGIAQNAPAMEDLSKDINNGINGYDRASHINYENGLNGDNGIIPRLDGQTLNPQGSALQEAAADALAQPQPGDHRTVRGFKSLIGDELKSNLRDRLTELAQGQYQTGEGNAAEIHPLEPYTARDLVSLRQVVREGMTKYLRGDPNRDALRRVMDGIDDALEGMAQNAADPTVIDDYRNLRNTYRQERAYLDSPTADKLNLHRPDQALNDVTKYLSSGPNAIQKIRTIRELTSPQLMNGIARARVADWRELALQDPDKFLKEFDSFGGRGPRGDAVKDEFFGNDTANQLRDLANTYQQTTDYAEGYAERFAQSAKDAHANANDAIGSLSGTAKVGTPGSGRLGSQLDSAFRQAHSGALEEIEGRYRDAVDAAQEAFNSAKENANDAFDTAKENATNAHNAEYDNKKLSGSFMKNLSEGRVNQALLDGQVDVQDIRNLKKTIGDKWTAIQDGIFARAIADASPNGRFDPEKMVEWWSKINPDVRRELFSLNDPGNLQNYQDAMDRVEHAAGVKRVVKGGTAVGLAAGQIAASAAVGSHFGPVGELMGGVLSLTGLAGTAKYIQQISDWVANHPNTWKMLERGSELSKTPAAQLGATAAQAGAGYATTGMLNKDKLRTMYSSGLQ